MNISSSSLGIFYMKRRTCVLETLNTEKKKKTPEIWYLYKKHQTDSDLILIHREILWQIVNNESIIQ